MKLLKAISFFLLIPLVSCDPYTGSFVTNNSNKKITVDIKYNRNDEIIKKYIKDYNGFEEFVKFIREYNSSKGNLTTTDLSKYVATIELNKKDTLQIWGGIRQSNDFDEIEEIIIHSNKKQTKIRGEDFQYVFDKKGAFYIYTVK